MSESPSSHKDTSRDGRLSYSNMAEHTLRKELNAIAIKSCKEKSEAFGDCAKKEGLFVVFKCREHNDTLNSCLNKFTNPTAFEDYKAKRAQEIASKTN